MKRGMMLGIGLLAAAFMSCSSSTEPDGLDASGAVIAHTDCKDFTTIASVTDVPADQNCIEYVYDGESVLLLRYVNGRFNCCPDSLTAAFTIATGSILIEEEEWASNPCDCICLYDLDSRVTGLPPGTYTITVDEPYRSAGAGLLEFTVDLATSPQGSYCVPRDMTGGSAH